MKNADPNGESILARLYHGTDTELSQLRRGSYVTKRLSDAWKFAYRKAVINISPEIFIYTVESERVERDVNRDGAFRLLEPSSIRLLEKRATYDAPYKLRTFTMSMRP